MADILAQILKNKRAETAARMKKTPLAEMQQCAAAAPPVRPFATALRVAADNANGNTRYPVIAEIKRKSPSKGELCQDFNPAEIAEGYERGGAACLSVLTDERYFGGCEDDLKKARAACALPVLRKDFIVLDHDNWEMTEWQLYESRAMGADAVLFIVSALQDRYRLNEVMQSFFDVAGKLRMTILMEVHDKDEIDNIFNIFRSPYSTIRSKKNQQQQVDEIYFALHRLYGRSTNAKREVIIGVNNRNLTTFHTNIQTTVSLAGIKHTQDGCTIEDYYGKNSNEGIIVPLMVSESGIKTPEDIKKLKDAGAEAFLVGESLVNDPENGLRRLFGG